jgi:hypothetical protein
MQRALILDCPGATRKAIPEVRGNRRPRTPWDGFQ